MHMWTEYHIVGIASELSHSMIYMGIFQSRDQIGNLVVIEERFPIDRVLVKTDSVGFPVLVWTRVSIGHFHYPQGKDYILIYIYIL